MMGRWQKYEFDRAGRGPICAARRYLRGGPLSSDLGKSRAGGDHRDDQPSIFGMDLGVCSAHGLEYLGTRKEAGRRFR
jgi:hypothetical protein